MHLSSCLAFIAGISSVHAFYPWELRLRVELSAAKDTIERRFVPWNLPETTTDDDPNSTDDVNSTSSNDSKFVTLDLKKTHVRRDNRYRVVKSHTPSLENSAALHQDGTDYSYFCVAQIGSQKQEMWMQLDTGAPHTWVYDSKCNETVCITHRTFDRSASTTYTTEGKGYRLYYGSGEVHGKLGTDTISVAGLDITQQFGQANNASEAFESYPFDGILGLGRSHTQGWNLPSFMDLIAEKKLLKSNLIGFSFSRAADGINDGEINFGGVDTTKFDGTISYTATNSNLWRIPVDDVYVNGHKCGFSGKSATIDTGTTYLLIPPADAKTLFSFVPGSSQRDDTNYAVPCNSTATIEFEFSGVKYNVSPKDYVGKHLANSTDSCFSHIVGYASNGDTWLVGDVFLKNVYTVFDYDNAQIGFGALTSASAEAQRANPNQSSNSSSTSAVASSAGDGTFTAPAVTSTAAIPTVSGSSASHLTRGISWSMLPVIIGAFAI